MFTLVETRGRVNQKIFLTLLTYHVNLHLEKSPHKCARRRTVIQSKHQIALALQSFIKVLVDDEDAVVVGDIPTRQIIVFELQVAEADRGKIIGRNGRNSKALRTLLNMAEAKYHTRIRLDILE